MNYYERIGRSIEFIENNLDEDFSVEDAAAEAYMSVSNFYRMFISIAGFTAKEYVRRRRLACAASELESDPKAKVLDLAIKYGYAGADAFTRSFKKEFGITPSSVRKHVPVDGRDKRENPQQYGLRRLRIMDEYFELKDKELLEAYPDIKVLKKLPSMLTACYKHYGPEPERHAFGKMGEWIRKNVKGAYRIFGFNNPDPADPESGETYGYEVCVTIDTELYAGLQDAPSYGLSESYPDIRRKTLSGGMFAVVSIKRDQGGDIGTNIMRGWQRFNKWMKLGRYVWGGQQYLEEHLGFTDEGEHIGGVDLYMPVREAPKDSK